MFSKGCVLTLTQGLCPPICVRGLSRSCHPLKCKCKSPLGSTTQACLPAGHGPRVRRQAVPWAGLAATRIALPAPERTLQETGTPTHPYRYAGGICWAPAHPYGRAVVTYLTQPYGYAGGSYGGASTYGYTGATYRVPAQPYGCMSGIHGTGPTAFSMSNYRN